MTIMHLLIYEEKKIGQCGGRTHDIRVISTTL